MLLICAFFCLLMKAVLSAHDTVAQKNFDPVLPPLPEDLDDDLEEESVKIVRLVKNKEPLVSAASHLSQDKITALPSLDGFYSRALECGFKKVHLL